MNYSTSNTETGKYTYVYDLEDCLNSIRARNKDNEDRKSPDDTYSVMAIGFVIPNQNCRESFWNYTKSIDDIEELTNLDFYSLLPDDIEDNIEAFYILDEWK